MYRSWSTTTCRSYCTFLKGKGFGNEGDDIADAVREGRKIERVEAKTEKKVPMRMTSKRSNPEDQADEIKRRFMWVRKLVRRGKVLDRRRVHSGCKELLDFAAANAPLTHTAYDAVVSLLCGCMQRGLAVSYIQANGIRVSKWMAIAFLRYSVRTRNPSRVAADLALLESLGVATGRNNTIGNMQVHRELLHYAKLSKNPERAYHHYYLLRYPTKHDLCHMLAVLESFPAALSVYREAVTHTNIVPEDGVLSALTQSGFTGDDPDHVEKVVRKECDVHCGGVVGRMTLTALATLHITAKNPARAFVLVHEYSFHWGYEPDVALYAVCLDACTAELDALPRTSDTGAIVDKAVALFQNALSTGKAQSPSLWIRLSSIYARVGDAAKAVALYHAAINNNVPITPSLVQNTAAACVHAGEPIPDNLFVTERGSGTGPHKLMGNRPNQR
eukprot:TRINITY_DN21302_c0_g1_i1.p1 TRINITY_DN21302_c0_g1~~TRINITY_DN21302_c0_g1_i1.p1  ORF type:complete len:466 (+),score=70.03 TRINITY_DN21302_c0_g1_i1:66-1400(+)